jgi:hypothetical protein
MNALQKGLLFAGLQVALVSSLGAKLLWDRGHLPRGWAVTRSYDPEALIRGRYAYISLLVKADKVFPELSQQPPASVRGYGSQNVYLTVENGRVVANPADHITGLTVSGPEWQGEEKLATLFPPVVYFLPEHVADPTRPGRNATLFVEVTIPRKGPPRPIRLAIQGDKTFTLLEIK